MKIRWKPWFSGLAMVLSLQLGLVSCASEEQQQLDELGQDQLSQEQLEDDLGQEEQLAEEGNFNNFENAGFNNAVGGENNFTNDFANTGGENQFGNLGAEQGEGDLQEIIEEMNQASNDPFAQGDVGGNFANNQGMFNNAQMANPMDQGMNMGMDQGMNMAMDQGMNAGMDQGMNAMNPAPMDQQSTATAGAPAAPGLPELGSKMSYIVQKGDTLAKIATKIYGDPARWTEIANFTGLANPRLIYPGDVVYYQLTEQSMAFAAAYESVSRAEVQIMEGDTLATIASRVYGSSANWKLIWRQNDNIANPDRLVAGTTLYYIEPGMLSSAIEKFRGMMVEAPAQDHALADHSLIADGSKADQSGLFDTVDGLNNDFDQQSDTDGELTNSDLNTLDAVNHDFVNADMSNYFDRMI